MAGLMRIAPGFCVEEVTIIRDCRRKTGSTCAQTVIILLTISVWKKFFIEQPNGINNGALDGKAEAIDERHARISRSVKDRENARDPVKRRPRRQLVDRPISFG